jgi:sulfate transport system ATP-binding protein
MTLLDLVQLAGMDRRYPSQLSGGQRQRVALARALAIEPRILLLDEPFGALDAKVRKELRRWLRELHDRTGHTTVFVTHDQEEALELADRVVVMSQGRIEQVGSADDIYDRPATPFVFDFIGDSSALPVTVDQGRIRLDSRLLSLDARGQPEGPATLFFRPHHTRVTHQDGGLTGIVRNCRRVGDVRRLELETGSGRHRIEVDVPAEAEVPRLTRLSVQLTNWRLFPASLPQPLRGQ